MNEKLQKSTEHDCPECGEHDAIVISENIHLINVCPKCDSVKVDMVDSSTDKIQGTDSHYWHCDECDHNWFVEIVVDGHEYIIRQHMTMER